jgi:type IV secretory pathway TrbD component
MRDLHSACWIKTKAALFVLIGLIAVALIVLETRSWQIATLLGLAIWAFARAYYFAFYVIEKYVDPAYRFAGLFDCARYLLGRSKRPQGDT